jgi:hypothetical protein
MWISSTSFESSFTLASSSFAFSRSRSYGGVGQASFQSAGGTRFAAGSARPW